MVWWLHYNRLLSKFTEPWRIGLLRRRSGKNDLFENRGECELLDFYASTGSCGGGGVMGWIDWIRVREWTNSAVPLIRGLPTN